LELHRRTCWVIPPEQYDEFVACMEDVLEVYVDYVDAYQAVLIWDQFDTHIPAYLYKALPPAEAWRLLDRLGIHYTPKHGS